jgi:hypothetical protein
VLLKLDADCGRGGSFSFTNSSDTELKLCARLKISLCQRNEYTESGMLTFKAFVDGSSCRRKMRLLSVGRLSSKFRGAVLAPTMKQIIIENAATSEEYCENCSEQKKSVSNRKVEYRGLALTYSCDIADFHNAFKKA